MKAGVYHGQAMMENSVQVSGRVVDGVSPWVISGQGMYVIVCHRFRR